MFRAPKLATALSLAAAVTVCNGEGGRKVQEDQANDVRNRIEQVASVTTKTARPEPMQTARKPVTNPVICINGSLPRNRNVVHPKFAIAFRRAGAKPVRINPENFESKAGTCNAFVLVGGPDIDTRKLPGKNRAPLHSKAHLMTPERQELDRRIVLYAREKLKPLFGECLGMQEIGVWEGKGASLNQHIPDDPNAVNHRGWHTVDFSEDASVFGLGTGIRKVLSGHHQALREPLPETLNVVARSADGIPEAIISSDGLTWAVQFHSQRGTSDMNIYGRFNDLSKRRGGALVQ